MHLQFKLVFLLGTALVLAACNKEDDNSANPQPTPATTGTFELNFTPEYNSGELALGKLYVEPLNQDSIRINDLKFHISNVVLVRSDGQEVPLYQYFQGQALNYHLFDFGTNKTNHAGGRSFTAQVPLGQYRGMKFYFGLPNNINYYADVSAFPPEHPLSIEQGMYWTWATRYRFFILDGFLDTLRNNDDPADYLGWSWHFGDSTFYQPIEYLDGDYAFEVRPNFETQFIVFAELSRMLDPFLTSLKSINLREARVTHNFTKEEQQLAQRVYTNWQASWVPVVNYIQIQ
jgi:hypothetical protein